MIIIVKKNKDKKSGGSKINNPPGSNPDPTKSPEIPATSAPDDPNPSPKKSDEPNPPNPPDKPTDDTSKPPEETNKPSFGGPIEPGTSEPKPTSEPIPPTNTIPQKEPLSSEYNITTKKDSLTSISVTQKSNDQSKVNDQIISTDATRETNYHIYILSEEDASPENQAYYQKMYTGAISIVSECYHSDNEECDMKEMVDITKMSQDESKARILEDNTDFEKIPLATCLFNITNNDFITSITCHKDFPDIKKNEMLLDLYFFRSPAIERKNKTRDNITITIEEDKRANKRKIHELNGGLCNIHNNWGSLCTTDMNITTDLNGNLLSYDEVAVTNIFYDNKNSYTKNKVSHLVDHSEKITKEDTEKYKKNLEKLLKKMKPYMEEDVQFPQSKFEELYNLVKNDGEEKETSKEKGTTRRRLTAADAIQYIRQKEIFHIDSLGIEVNLRLKLNPGLNTNAMRGHLNFSFDEEEHNVYKHDQLTDIQNIIDQLKALSRAGNLLAAQLYDKISDNLENLPKEIKLKLLSLYDLVQYYDLFHVFNYTLETISHNKLPSLVIKLSEELYNKINSLYVNIEIEGDVKKTVEDLRDLLYKFVDESHDLVDAIYQNLKELNYVILTKDNPFTQITNYYLNNTSISYVKLVERAFKVFDTYFIREYNRTYPKIEAFIKLFEEKSYKNLEDDREYVYDMYTRLMNKSYTIVGVSDTDLEKVLSNFLNTYNYMYDIIKLIREFIIKKIDIKDSGYYLTLEEIASRNKTYYSLFPEIDAVLEKLKKDDYIDKVFDEIIINFKDGYNDILKKITDKKYEYFTLDEFCLKGTLFTETKIATMETKIKEYTTNILNKIHKEVDYKNKAKVIIDDFVEKNSEELSEIISDLEVLVSEDALEDLTIAFEKSLNKSLKKLSDDIDMDKKLTEEYFNHFYKTMNDNDYLLELLKTYHVDEIPKIKQISGSSMEFRRFLDEIYRKERTNAYMSKYNSIVSTWDYNQKYLKNQLFIEVLADYKNIYNQIKEILQNVIKLGNLQNYTDLEDLEFYKAHSEVIDTLQKRIDKYFSDEIFEAKYTKFIEEVKTESQKDIVEEKNYIASKHKYISDLTLISNSVEDFCIYYKRKSCYGCTNCVWNTLDFGRFCLVLVPYDKNYLKIVKSHYEKAENNKQFNISFHEFYDKIYERINKYNSTILELENELKELKEKTLGDSIESTTYLIEYATWVKSIISDNFGDEIVKASYDHYYNKINEKFDEILKFIFDKYKSLFNTLHKDLSFKYSEIKYTMYEFSLMGEIYQTILKTDLISNYFNSIIIFQKTEFNYTITQYYEYFYRLVNNSYTYILANLPKEEDEFNEFFIERKNKTLEYFELIFANITKAETTSLNFQHQKNVLKVTEADFFLQNANITKTINELDEVIEDKIDDIFDIELFESAIDITQNSLTTRFYLENKEFGKLIEQIYDPLEQGNFFYLKLDKFKDMMTQNWIIDGNDFSNIINTALYESNKEIKSELNAKYQEYSVIIENEIKRFFSKDIEYIVSELYSLNVKDLKTSQIADIKTLIMDKLSTIKETIKNSVEEKILNDNNIYNFSAIEQTVQFYKDYIFESLNKTIYEVLNQFYHNIKTNVYTNCIEEKLNQYLEVARTATSKEEYGEFEMLNSTYKVGDIVYNLTSNVVKKYMARVSKKINFKYIEYYGKILYAFDLKNLREEINNEIDNIYQNEIIAKLTENNEKATDTPDEVEYDFDESLKKDINNTIDSAMEEIAKIISTTKGSNFEASFKCPLSFADSGTRVIIPICEALKVFLGIENEDQIADINKYIKDTITSNLDDFLANVVPTFGNEFFDRIIDYNINFKMIDLYSNLHYALGQHFLYYAALGRYSDAVEKLPIDLKFRLYRLNDLNYTIEYKKDEITSLLEEKLSELIADLKDVAKDQYTLYIKENEIIKKNFSPKVLKAIENNLIEIMPQIRQDYEEALEKYLKERFMNKFTQFFNEETDNMLKIFYKEKEKLINELDKLFSEKIDEDLHEVNMKFYETSISIFRYYKFMTTFYINETIINFFNLYTNTSITPIINQFRYDLENLTFSTIMEDINNKSQIIEKINRNEFLDKIRELMKYFELNYYNPILSPFDEYTYYPYENLLLKTRDEFLNRNKLRLLEESEDAETETKIQESKDVEETFEQIIQLVTNQLSYALSCLEYFVLYNTGKRYYVTSNIAYKDIKNRIKENKYSKNINEFLVNKLFSLHNILGEYYFNIKKGLLEFRFHQLYYAERINAEGLTAQLLTATTLNNRYKIILATTKNFTETYSETEDDIDSIEYKHKTEHMINKATAEFKLMQNLNLKLICNQEKASLKLLMSKQE